MADHDTNDQQEDYDLNDITDSQESAADLIRNKLNTIYDDEPDAKEEQAEVESIPQKALSKHQKYMKELSSSGKSVAEIQVAWHEYYTNLPDNEKHEVWQEFYSEHQKVREQAAKAKHEARGKKAEQEKSETLETDSAAAHITATPADAKPHVPVSNNTAATKSNRYLKAKGNETSSDIRNNLLSQIQKRSNLTSNPHMRSLAFGLTMGSVTLFILLFGFFNERFITPFIRPNSHVSATPIIVDPNAAGPVGNEPKIIIPKINLEAPVVYNVPTIEEKDVQKGLESGVVHYITTPNPGEKGNSVIFGHSSSNILNKGKYKFAFILLKSLDKGDTFIVQKDGKRYVYKVYNKFVTAPNDLSVLGATDKPATMTLITCDPPGTSTNRLIIQAEQIFPDPGNNAPSSVAPASENKPKQLPSNSVSLWQRITSGRL